MRRGAVVFAIVAVLLIADGSYLQATHNEVGGDSGTLFGNAHLFISAGKVVLFSGILLIVAAAIMWGVAIGRDRRASAASGQAGQPNRASQPHNRAAQTHPAVAQPQAAAAPMQVGEEQGHQRQS
jgi:hypothetical protein